MTQEQKNVSIPGVTVNTSISTFPAPVGIGASDPQSVLHIVSRSPVVKVEDIASGSTASPNIQFLASDGIMGFVGYTGSYYGATGMHLFNAESTPIFISTNNLERVRITQSGGMGIGMTAPTTALGVSGSGSFSGIVSASGISTVGATFAGNISVGGVMVGKGNGGTNNTVVSDTAVSNIDGAYNTAIGSGALQGNTSGSANTAIGANALYYNKGNRNTSVGYNSLFKNSTGSDNVAVGHEALMMNITGGNSNTAIGRRALSLNLSGYQNTAVGTESMYSCEAGRNNIALGFEALHGNTGGDQNIAIGVQALYANKAGYNIGIGYQALFVNDSGSSNVAVGHYALLGNTNGNSNTAIGHAAMQLNKRGSSNSALGYYSLLMNDTGINNTALGANTLNGNTSGNFNVAIGNAALYNNTASYNTAVGEGSLFKNTTGGSNTSVGRDSLTSNISGDNNSALGVNALWGNSGGSENTAIGVNTLVANISGGNNSALGSGALAGNSGGNYNTAIGRSALGYNYDSSNNTAIGYAALHGNTAGSNSTAVGYQAGYSPTTLGTIVRGVFIGANAIGANPASSTDEIVIGAGATGKGNNTAVIGKSDQTTATIYGVVTASLGVTAPRMFTTSLTASTLHVTGVSTLAGVTAQSLFVSVGITAAKMLATKLSVGATASIDFQDTLTVTPPFSEAPQGIGFYSAENLLRNGNFPDTVSGGVAEGWTVYGYAGASNTSTDGTASWVAAAGGSGPRGVAAVVLQCNSGGGAYQTVNLTPGAVYTVSARIRVSTLNSSDASQARFAIGLPSSSTGISDVAVNVDLHDSGNSLNKWCYCSQTFTVPASALLTTPILVGVRSFGSTHSIQVTDIALYKGGIAKVFSPITVQEDRQQVLIGGNIGVGGVTAPTARLHVTSTTENSMILETTKARGGGQNYLTFNDPTGRKGYLGYGSTVTDEMRLQNTMVAPLYFATSNSDRMVILADGKVGIGTSTPIAGLEISGINASPHLVLRSTTTNTLPEIRFMETTSSSWALVGSCNSSGANGTFAIRDDFQSGTPVRLAITRTGNVGIGITEPTVALDVVGGIKASTTLNVAGVATLAGVTAQSLNVVGVTTLAGVTAAAMSITGGLSAATMFTSSLTASTLHVTGTATLAGVTAQSLTVSGGITATSINVSSYQLASTGFNNQAGTAYTILATDNGKIVTGSNTSAITFTLPAAAIGFSVTIIQSDTGSITIKPNGSDTLNSFGKTSTAGLTTGGQWAAVDVVCTAGTTWALFGNLA